jgi:hypothetical protein
MDTSSTLIDNPEIMARFLQDQVIEGALKGTNDWKEVSVYCSEEPRHPNFEKYEYRKPDVGRGCPACLKGHGNLLVTTSSSQPTSFYCPRCRRTFNRETLDSYTDKFGWHATYNSDGDMIMPNGNVMKTTIFDNEDFSSLDSRVTTVEKYEDSCQEQSDEKKKNHDLVTKTLMENMEEYFESLKDIEAIYDNAIREITDSIADDGSQHELTEYSVKQYALKAVFDAGKKSAKSIGQILRESWFPKPTDVVGRWEDLCGAQKSEYEEEAMKLISKSSPPPIDYDQMKAHIIRSIPKTIQALHPLK